MNNIEFYKYQGTGNDFILIDGYNYPSVTLSEKLIQQMCHRTFGIGADGLMVVRKKQGYDFEMEFYNSDGKKGSMCGNGGRCIVAFASYLQIINDKTIFWAPDGEHEAVLNTADKISLKMSNVDAFSEHELGIFMDTGSPHLVISKKKNEFNVVEEGRKIRNSKAYKQEGVNVNFLDISADKLFLGTYERGVENETYSCGTGTVASALAASIIRKLPSPIYISTKGGDLTVHFKTDDHKKFTDIWLSGQAVKVYKGTYFAD